MGWVGLTERMKRKWTLNAETQKKRLAVLTENNMIVVMVVQGASISTLTYVLINVVILGIATSVNGRGEPMKPEYNAITIESEK